LRLLVLAALAALAAPAAVAGPAGGVAVSKDGVEVSILPLVAPAKGPDSLIEVALDVEARTDAAARRLGFRSLRAAATIDCEKGANRFSKAEAYAGPDLHGEARPWPVGGGWVRPSADSFMSAVTDKVCAPAAPGAARVVMAGAEATATPPATASATPTPPGPAAANSASASAPPALTPVAAADASAQPATARPASVVAQVAASPDIRDARRVLAELKALIAPPLSAAIEPALIDGVRQYRAGVLGFASTADARAFCARAADAAPSCWVRPVANGNRR